MVAGPLADVRVVDASPFLPGPFAAQILGDLGATVIKVEPPGGDPARTVPGRLYETTNRNKLVITLDLKTTVGQQRCHRLVEDADVFVEGYRPGVADRLGVSYAALRAHNPGLIYCSISGYGQTGPKRMVPGHDVTYLAAAGALAVAGSATHARPHRSGLPVGDLTTSAYAALAVLAALHERRTTGRGCRLDLAIADAAMTLAAVRAGDRLDNEENGHLNPANDIFPTSDGFLAVGAVEEHFWARLRTALSPFEPRLTASRFDDLASRRENSAELSALLGDVFSTRPGDEWSELLASADVPAERVVPVRAAAESDQVRSRGIVQSRHGQNHVVFPALRDGVPMGALRRVAGASDARSTDLLTVLDEGRDPWAAAGEDA